MTTFSIYYKTTNYGAQAMWRTSQSALLASDSR